MKTLYKYMYTWQAEKRRKQFEQKTNCTWSYSPTGDGYQFSPCVTQATLPAAASEYAVLSQLTNQYLSFIQLAKLTGLSIRETVQCAKYLIDARKAKFTVNRIGAIVGISKVDSRGALLADAAKKEG